MVKAERIKGNKNYTKVALVALLLVIAVSAIFSLGLTKTKEATAAMDDYPQSTQYSFRIIDTKMSINLQSIVCRLNFYYNLQPWINSILSSDYPYFSVKSFELYLMMWNDTGAYYNTALLQRNDRDTVSYPDYEMFNNYVLGSFSNYELYYSRFHFTNNIQLKVVLTVNKLRSETSSLSSAPTSSKTIYSNVKTFENGEIGNVIFDCTQATGVTLVNNRWGYWAEYAGLGDKITPPSMRNNTHFFKGWRTGSMSDGEVIDFNTYTLGNDTVFYPVSVDRSHVVFFETNGGSEIEYAVRNSDGEITRPEDPVKAGYRFENWYSDAALTNVYDFAQQSEKKPPATLYAGWIDLRKTVTFNTNGGNIIDPVHVYENEKILPPTAPTQTDKVFDGWYADAELTQKFNFNSPVTEDITLYAKWLSVCTVTFNTGGGSAIDPAKVTQGNNVPVPNTPTLAGKGFGGWYTDSALTKKYLFNVPVEKSFTLYAKWTTDYVIVRLVIISAKQERDVLIERNSTLYKPTTPTLYGFKFGGWYTDGGTFENEYDFNSPVKSDLRLYIRWDIDYISVTVDKRDDSKISTVEVQRGKKLELEEPKRVGYTFQGWFTDEELTVPFDTETVVEEPFGVYAKWLKETDKPSEIDKVKDEIKDIADKAKDQANKVGDFFKKNWYWFVVGLGGAALIWLTVAIIMEIKKK